MTTPIDPVTLTDAASKISGVTVKVNPAEEPSLEALTQRFQTMMHGPHHAENVPGTEGPNMVSEVLSRGEDMMRHEHAQLEQFGREAPHMTPAETLARTAQLIQSTTANQFRMHAAMSIATGTNKSMQTLLKNQ